MFKFSTYDAVVIQDDKQKAYFTGYRASGYLLITRNEYFYVTDMRYFSALEKALENTKFKAVLGGDYSFLFSYLKEAGIKRIGIDYTTTTLSQSAELKKCALLADVSGEISAKMIIKNQFELDKISRACQITQETFWEVLPKLKVGVTEREIEGLLISGFLSRGAEEVSFELIVAFGQNSAVPHHRTGLTRLEKNTPVLFDIGCVVDGYCSDFTRTVFFGQPTYEFIKAYNAVNQAYDCAYSGIEVGAICGDIDKLARDILEKEGLPFIHSLGHGVGVNIHEEPYLRKGGKQKLENGMVFTIEPGAYLDGKFGIRTENTCYIKDGIINNFYTLGRELIIVEKDKITKY